MTVSVIVQIQTENRMNAGYRDRLRNDGPKGSVLNVTVIPSLRAISDAVSDTATATGAAVNSLIGSGKTLQMEGVKGNVSQRGGYWEIGVGIPMVESKGVGIS
jgi:hypothetical protein